MTDDKSTQRRILEAGEAMFRERGVERTILTDVAKAADAALGSVTHFFRTKPDLAAAVLDQVVGRLADDAKAALSHNGGTLAEDIRALPAICVQWPARHGRLIAMLEPYASAEWQGRSVRLRDRLAPILADWARRRGVAEVTRLSPSQLYAVVLAPGLCAVELPVAVSRKDAENLGDRWLGVLTAAALAAIAPPVSKGHLAGKDTARSALAARQEADR